MLYKTISAAVYGIDANLIEVEVDVSPVKGDDNTHFLTVGLPDAAVRESRERVRSALKNSGYDVPPSVTTINLAPADLRKEGSGFDLPMALGILGAYGGLRNNPPDDALFVGELSLDGGIRGVRGALPIAISARANKIRKLILPKSTPAKPRWLKESMFTRCRSLMDVVQFLNTGNGIQPLKVDTHALLDASAAILRRFPGRAGAANRQARHRSLRRRWT